MVVDAHSVNFSMTSTFTLPWLQVSFAESVIVCDRIFRRSEGGFCVSQIYAGFASRRCRFVLFLKFSSMCW